jgi:hypothetical protein
VVVKVPDNGRIYIRWAVGSPHAMPFARAKAGNRTSIYAARHVWPSAGEPVFQEAHAPILISRRYGISHTCADWRALQFSLHFTVRGLPEDLGGAVVVGALNGGSIELITNANSNSRVDDRQSGGQFCSRRQAAPRAAVGRVLSFFTRTGSEFVLEVGPTNPRVHPGRAVMCARDRGAAGIVFMR